MASTFSGICVQDAQQQIGSDRRVAGARALVVRSEYLEGKILVSFLRRQGLLFSHLPLNTWTASYKTLARNKASGVVKGVPDYVVIVPGNVLFVELKRVSGGKASKEQEIWVRRLTDAGCPSRVCRGAEEAISFVKEFL